MNLFEKKTASDEPVTGVTVLRQTVANRNGRPHSLTAISREIDGVSTATLEAFGAGKADLSVDRLQALTKILYPHSEYDPESGMLRSSNREPSRPLYTADLGRPFDPKSSPTYTPVGPGPHLPGPQPVKPENVQKPKGRPGWLGGFL